MGAAASIAWSALRRWARKPTAEERRAREAWSNTIAVVGLFNELTPPPPKAEEPRRG